MKYRIQITEKIEKKLRRIPAKTKNRIIEKIDSLGENPRPSDCKKLHGSKNHPIFRVRVGDYRILYSIQDSILLVLVVDVGDRKNVYKER